MKESKPTYFIDLDGTLFDKVFNHQIISKKNLDAIRFIKNYANVVISTGRSFHDKKVQQIMLLLDIQDVIASSGAEIYIDRKLVKSYPIENELLTKIRMFASAGKINFAIFHNQGENFYTSKKIYFQLSNLFLKKKFNTILKQENYEDLEKVYKVSFLILNSFASKKILSKMQLFFKDSVNLNLASNNYVLEITSIKANKGLATSAYCYLKGIDVKKTYHIGDSMSDLSTKGYVNQLVAMSNASKELKASADIIAPKWKKGGISKFLLTTFKSK